jgi:hypothetical protein
MKKIYFLVACAFVTLSATAQMNDTITAHIAGTPTFYTWGAGNGYVTGNNTYGDKAIVQLFDNTHGVVTGGTGTINGVFLWVARKADAGGSYTVNIWSDNAGAPGTVLASKTITLAATDTSLANISYIYGQPTAYNVNANFTTPIAIPSSGKFWAGVTLPTTAAAGDTIVFVGNTDGDFADAGTHSGVIDASNAFISFGTAGPINIASAIFPYVTYTSVAGVNEVNVAVASVYPNPTNGALNFVFASNETSFITVLDLTGKTVARVDVNGATTVTADFSELAVGSYVYQTVNFDGVVTSISKFVRN